MARWYYQSVFDEIEDMRKLMDSLSRQAYASGPPVLLPAAGEPGTKMLPAQRAGLRVDVAETESEVIVTADLIPNISKKDISLSLLDPQALEISYERKEEKQEENEGYFLRERRFGSMTRVVPLPMPVSEDESSATFRNGVLEVHLKKTTKDQKGKIFIE